MTIANATDMMIPAAQGKYSVGAFNITSLIQMEAVVEAATEKKSPVIIQCSVTPTKFLKPNVLVAMYRALAEEAPVPICLHLDHCTDMTLSKLCADTGYTNIMMDSSKKPFEDNIAETIEIVDYCHKLGHISVEAEVGTVSGVEDQIKVTEDEAQLCSPEQAVEFVERTHVDIFAPAIGTAHGVYKTKNPKIHFERFGEINKLLNGDKVNTPLVVHGGTGIPEDMIKRLVELGGAKFNCSTELKHTLIDTTQSYLAEHKDEYDPGKIDVAVKNATREVVGRWMDTLGSTGKA
jgi:tagatose 1,6-diphosphate aldolase GatY/KbaY